MTEAAQPQSIQSRIIKLENIRWKELHFIQQPDFKEWFDQGDQKLIESILKYQFVAPFMVWESEDKIYCLDGFHRYQDLATIERMGVDVPEELPAAFVNCSSMQEAAELVLVYSSAYAKVTQQGLFDFVAKYDIDFAEIKAAIHIPEFSVPRYEQKFNLFDTKNAEEPEVVVLENELIVKTGDLFELNGHRVICGSFQEPGVQSSLMAGKLARIVICDPPYNLPADFFLKDNRKHNNHTDFAMGAGEMTDDEFAEFLASIMRTSVAHTVPGAIHYIFMDWRHSWHMTDAARKVYGSPVPKQLCVWAKDMMANGSFYRAQQELCFIFNSPQAKALWNRDLLDEGGFYKDNDDELVFIFKNGEAAKHLSHLDLADRIRSNVWRYPSATSTANPDRFELKNHPTPKPVAMIADAILDTTNEGDIVIDWFHGSGTCIIAAEQTGRICHASDIEPKYVQAEIIRYINYCKKRNREINFKHLTGSLTLNDFEQWMLKN